jgi:hypothetical protein
LTHQAVLRQRAATGGLIARESRGASPDLTEQLRDFAPIGLLSTSLESVCLAPTNIFSLWLFYNNAARLTSNSYPPIVMLAPASRSAQPAWGRVDDGNSPFIINRLQRSTRGLRGNPQEPIEATRRSRTTASAARRDLVAARNSVAKHLFFISKRLVPRGLRMRISSPPSL